MATTNPPMQYNSPKSDGSGTPSSIGKQARTDFFRRKALDDVLDELRFTQMASTFGMPKHYGTEIKRDRYIRILDDRNQNQQGLDTSGNKYANGNLYGGSKDIEKITAAQPVLGEEGGRVNRVGLTRLQMTSTMQEYGIFLEFTANAVDFDSDPSLQGRYTTELMRAATEVYEDKLGIDLVNGAGTVHYSGAATNNGTMTGEGSDVSLVTYADLKRIQRKLDELKAPRRGRILKGASLDNTTPVDMLRTIYIGYDLQPVLEAMVDEHNDRAFIPREKYASQMMPIAGEIGMIAGFRVVIAPRMVKWAGKGAAVTAANKGYQATSNRYDVFPMLVITPEAFTTISFHSSNQSGGKFSLKTTAPGAQSESDPYGKKGRMSLQWWYGMMITDPMWLAVIKTVAPI